MIVKFFFLNILKTKCNRVRERAFFTLSRTLSCVVFKIFKKKNFTFINSAFVNNLRFFINKCIHLLKTRNFDRKVLKMQRYSSVTLHVSPKNPISAEKLKITFSEIQIQPRNFVPEVFGPKQIEAIRFQNGFHDHSAQTDCSKEMWILILKGLKHLNSV